MSTPQHRNPETIRGVEPHVERDPDLDPFRPRHTGPEVCEQTGISYRQLDYWCRTGYITPSQEAAGSGSQRLWSDVDVEGVRAVADGYREARRIAERVTSGVSFTEARESAIRSVTHAHVSELVGDIDELLDRLEERELTPVPPIGPPRGFQP